MSRYRKLLFAALALALTACGGGGGGGDSGGESRNASIVAIERALSATTNPDTTQNAVVSARFELSNVPDDGLAFEIESDGDSVVDANIFQLGPTTGATELRLAAGNSLAAGVYTENVTVKACYDEACARQIGGSPLRLTLRYEIRPPERAMALELTPPPAAYGTSRDSAGPVASALIRVINPPVEPLQIREGYFYDPDGILVSRTVVPVAEGYRIDFRLTPGAQLDLGNAFAYGFFEVCLEADCRRTLQLGGAVPRFDVAYTITPRPLAALAAVEMPFDSITTDLAWNATTGKIYFSRNDAYTYHYLAALDPVTGVVRLSQDLLRHLPEVEMARDGSRVYVADNGGAVHRIDPDDLSLQSTLRLPPDPTSPFGGPRIAEELAAAPGTTDTLAISARSSPDYVFDTVVYDGDSARPDQLRPFDFTHIAWNDDATALYGTTYLSADLFRVPVTSSGIGPGESLGLLASPDARLVYAEGRVYSSAGDVADVATRARVARLAGTSISGIDVVVDTQRRRVFLLHRPRDTGDDRITAYDMDSFAEVAAVTLPEAVSPQRLIRWGDRGLAVLDTRGKIYLYEGSLVDGAATP